ncbi:MAG: response regulator [Desulfobacterales bacterium]|nr:response regulator [Desulfobacterales bacterium]
MKKKMVVIAEQASDLTATLLPWLTERGYRFQAVDDMEDIVASLISRNRISVLLLDDTVSNGSICDDIAIVKRMFGDVPIIVTTKQNDAEKEKYIRKLGVFYYHVKACGVNDLKAAISCAMQDAVESYLSYGQVRGGGKEMATHILRRKPCCTSS